MSRQGPIAIILSFSCPLIDRIHVPLFSPVLEFFARTDLPVDIRDATAERAPNCIGPPMYLVSKQIKALSFRS